MATFDRVVRGRKRGKRGGEGREGERGKGERKPSPASRRREREEARGGETIMIVGRDEEINETIGLEREREREEIDEVSNEGIRKKDKGKE